ncbi:MAG TPA: response regulator transcription factor [Myxococcota bacterium]|nr:response regulator transcription factor [Myxococcota bacterium]
MTQRRRVLVVEDDPAMARALCDGFEFEGYAVQVAHDGSEGLRVAREAPVDLIVLDVMLPRMSGLEICQRLRAERDDVPIILLTARSQESDKVEGLRLGADDYVTKPFGFDELVARVEAVLRRARTRPEAETLRFGDVHVDFTRLRATRAGEPLELSPREFAILACLAARRGEVVTREQLLHEVWGYESQPVTRTVDMHIAKLRRKIEPKPFMPEFIVTVHGEGYRFVG